MAIKNNRHETISNLLKFILVGGAVAIAMTSPYFLTNILFKKSFRRSYKNLKEKKKFYNTFYYLKRRGLIEIENINNQIYISLTKEGKQCAGKYQIDELSIEKPSKWDKKWRVIVFDIPEKYRIKREAFRGKLKELGFAKLQESVWAHPYECDEEIDLLREFFGLSDKNLQLLLVENISNDYELRSKFKV
ncbi:hypothetical protein KKG29_01060 [Patescibacteria group bacterium]|nr:hypothetical protein [Patescibacteria group bacterium]MBU4368438.1 hypothetical protein [Patescibacteria group bacterium]